VGKSAIVLQFVTGNYVSEYGACLPPITTEGGLTCVPVLLLSPPDPTIEDAYVAAQPWRTHTVFNIIIDLDLNFTVGSSHNNCAGTGSSSLLATRW
jgi:hypothetical protein